LHHIPLDQIVWNPWRDDSLFPIDPDHVADLRASINEHGFFASVKGRRRGGKVEIACGHARLEAAKKAKLDSIPIFIDDMDDDTMLRLMTDENALQSGAHAGAIINEVAAVTRRLIEGLAAGSTNVPPAIKAAFEDKGALDRAAGKLRNGTDIHLALGYVTIRRYFGEGNPQKAHRGERQIREAISALKQSGRYDEIVADARAKYAQPVVNAKSAKDSAVTKTKPKQRRILDERTANIFSNDHQFHVFREAVTTRAAQRVIPVNQQLALAKSIMDPGHREKKQVGAPYIKMMVQSAVQEGMKGQRAIDKEERELYLAEQREAEIDDELRTATWSLRSLHSAIAKLISLADKYPHHPKIGGFSAKLDMLVKAIQQLSKKLK
jgi:hypothetical protein